MERKYNLEAMHKAEEIRTLGQNIESKAGAVALGMQDAQSHVGQMKSTIESGISLIQSRVKELTSMYYSMTSESSELAAQVKKLETQVNATRKEVKEAETLANLRKEQADELRRKSEGNYHSSWMGLWRPLSDQSRVGLLIAAIFFGLIAVLLLVLYGKQILPGVVLAYFVSANQSNFNSQLGGRRRKE